MGEMPRCCAVLSGVRVSADGDRTGWLGREDSNLRMAESKSKWFALFINAHSEKLRKFDVHPFKRLADISECRDALRAVSVMRPLPSEGRGREFESRRARHGFNELA